MSKSNQATPSAAFADSKPHYALLDALRGAAALMVVWYHFFEGFAFAEGTAITTFNHGHLGIRRLSTCVLAILTAILGVAWCWFATTDVSGYDMIGIGWTLDTANFWGGMLRMLFPFSLGMLMARNFKPVKIKGIFWIVWAVLFALFSVPAFEKCGTLSINGLYEFVCILLVFPAIVWFTASGETTGKVSSAFCKFLGDISYPLYIVHYPVMYLFYSWLIKNKLYTLGETWPVVIMVFAINIALAYACLKLYDEPVRRWLTKRFIKSK